MTDEELTDRAVSGGLDVFPRLDLGRGARASVDRRRGRLHLGIAAAVIEVLRRVRIRGSVKDVVATRVTGSMPREAGPDAKQNGTRKGISTTRFVISWDWRAARQ